MITILDVQIHIAPLMLGFCLAFFGWILYWTGLNLSGAVLGGFLCLAATLGVAVASGNMKLFFPLGLILAVPGALIGIFLFRKIHAAVFFFAGALIGIAAASAVLPALSAFRPAFFAQPPGSWIFKAACSLLGGLILWRFNRYIISVLTAAAGTILLMASWDFRGDPAVALGIYFSALLFQFIVIHGRARRRSNNDD